MLIQIGSENEQGEETNVELSVGEYIIHELASDEITFDDAVYESIRKEFAHYILEEERVPDNSFFVQHPNADIARTTVDLVSFRYFLSENWINKHHIYTTLEEDKLAYSAKRAVYALKLNKVRSMIQHLQEEIKTHQDNFEKVSNLLEKQVQLEQAKMMLANELERIIVA